MLDIPCMGTAVPDHKVLMGLQVSILRDDSTWAYEDMGLVKGVVAHGSYRVIIYHVRDIGLSSFCLWPGDPLEEPGFITIFTIMERNKWMIIFWDGNAIEGDQIFGTEFHRKYINWPWFRIQNSARTNSIIIVREGKPNRLCRPGDVIIINLSTGQYADDLQYLPIL